MTRTGVIDDVQIELFDQTIEMKVNEIQSGGRAPMAQ
jgi:hypothetical protein